MITGLRYDAFHSICKKFNDKDSLKNNDIIYVFLFSFIIVYGTYVLVWNNLLSKQSTRIKLPNEDEKRTIRELAIIATMLQRSPVNFFSKVFPKILL